MREAASLSGGADPRVTCPAEPQPPPAPDARTAWEIAAPTTSTFPLYQIRLKSRRSALGCGGRTLHCPNSTWRQRWPTVSD